MPHVVIEEALDLAAACEAMQPALKRLMGIVAKQLHDAAPGSRFGKTNLQEFLG